MELESFVCAEWPDQPENCKIIRKLVVALTVVAFLGTLIMIVFMVIMRKYCTFVQKLVLTLTVYTNLACLPTFMQPVRQDSACRAQGFFIQILDWICLGWTCIITATIYQSIKGNTTITKYYWKIHSLLLIFALSLSTIPFFGDAYGPAGLWCWIKEEALYYRFGIWYVPFIICSFIILVTYIYTIYHVYRTTSPAPGRDYQEAFSNKKYRAEVRSLLAYPAINFIFYSPITVYRIEDAVHPTNTTHFSLAVFAVIFAQSSGFALVFVYFLILMRSHEISWTEFKQNVVRFFTKNPKGRVVKFEVLDEPYQPYVLYQDTYRSL